MKDYVFDNIVIEFWETVGKVVRADQLSEPRHREEDVIWVRDEEGDESAIDISRLNFQVRPGDEVQIISASTETTDDIIYALLRNYRSGDAGLLDDGEYIYTELVEAKPSSTPFWFALLLGSVGTWFFAGWGLLIGIAFYILVRIEKKLRKQRLIAGLLEHVQKLDRQNVSRSVVHYALARNLEETQPHEDN
ncbi:MULTISPECIES: hypothetical protein [unclassified Pseudomonas]|uniref:hypothetical protein n=1 Tax=unclassified Pseudomonas TaxID=196821 RepID=UPI000A1F24D4|nr:MULTISPECIES: hypothetical protein [unclassified Pseudomonas]